MQKAYYEHIETNTVKIGLFSDNYSETGTVKRNTVKQQKAFSETKTA